MTRPATERSLLLCLHNHQPVGNFDFVLSQATADSYRPFFETLADFPSVKVTVHFSGYLLRWLADNEPRLIDLVRSLVSRGQVEILGGGMYEPILALLPDEDRVGQVRALTATVKELFGRAPEGAWLAERVWEPDLPASLSAAGVRYLPVDDYHFLRAGVSPDELDGVYLTEGKGGSVLVFPGSERLRYLIPFGGFEDALDEVAKITSRDIPYPAAIFADDGEKFGVWPGTKKSVYDDGWLRNFLGGIEKRKDDFTTSTFSEYVAKAPVRGRVYLPTCSYIEMGEWSLPSEGAMRFGEVLHGARDGKYPGMKPYLSGGFFRGFLRKYEESNQLHKRMWGVSTKIAALPDSKEKDAARDHLYRAQSNDVYWHGVFGGLYLNHLREAGWTELLKAEAGADKILHHGKHGWTEAVRGDLDIDGGEEILIRTPHLALMAHLHDGGALTEISLSDRGIPLGHVLTRREEGYHAKFKNAGGSFDGSTSIHDVLILKDPSVIDALGVDPCQRASFREQVYAADVLPVSILSGEAAPLAVTAGKEVSVEMARRGSHVDLAMTLPLSAGSMNLSVGKRLEVEGTASGFRATFRIVNRGTGEASFIFSSEWNLNFLAGTGPDRWITWNGGRGDLCEKAVAPGLTSFRVVDAWRDVAVTAKTDRSFTLVRDPVETASLSEAGAEKIHQGVCLRLLFPVRVTAGGYEDIAIDWGFTPAS